MCTGPGAGQGRVRGGAESRQPGGRRGHERAGRRPPAESPVPAWHWAPALGTRAGPQQPPPEPRAGMGGREAELTLTGSPPRPVLQDKGPHPPSRGRSQRQVGGGGGAAPSPVTGRDSLGLPGCHRGASPHRPLNSHQAGFGGCTMPRVLEFCPDTRVVDLPCVAEPGLVRRRCSSQETACT